MNFRPTLWKIIISSIVGIVFGFFMSRLYIKTYPTQVQYEFGMHTIISFIIGFVIIYLIWSFIQKKR